MRSAWFLFAKKDCVKNSLDIYAKSTDILIKIKRFRLGDKRPGVSPARVARAVNLPSIVSCLPSFENIKFAFDAFLY